MQEVGKVLNLETSTFQSKEEKVEIAGSIEVKGIKGTDRRRYLVDIQGTTPRDANYIGDEYHSCVVRPELVVLYQKTKNIEAAQAQMKILQEKLDKERKPEPEEPKEDADEETKKKYIEEKQKRMAEENKQKITVFEQAIKDAPTFTYNANLFK